jgi:PAS domain S-box-containing protein
MGDAAVLVHDDWRIANQNAKADEISGEPAPRAIGKTLWESWFSAIVAPIADELRQAMAERLPLQFEQQTPGADGHAVWYDVRTVPIDHGLAIVLRDVFPRVTMLRDRAGQFTGAKSDAIDLTERKYLEEQAARLQELTAALSAALSAQDVGAAIIERAMPALGANAGNVYLLSDDERELVSIAAAGYAPETLARARRMRVKGPTMMAEVVRTGAPILLGDWQERVDRYPHHRAVHARGGDRAAAGLPLKVEGRPIGALSFAFPTDRVFDADDRRFMATVADLCAQALERARLYEVIRGSEARFRQLADSMPQIAWVIAAEDMSLEYLNKRWFDYTGAEPAAIGAAAANEPIHPEDRPLADADWAEALRTGQPFARELRLRAADGSYRWFLSRGVPVSDTAGRIVKWFGTSTDIDDAKRAESRQRFLAELGHTLAGSLDPDETLRRVARLVIPTLGDYCFVDLVQADGRLQRVAWAHIDPAEERLFDRTLADYVPRQLHEAHPITRTLETGEPQFVPDVTDAWLEHIAFSPEHLEFMRGRRLRSQMTVPLRARGRTLGALTVCRTTASDRRYTPDDLLLARDIAERAALAVDNARLYSETREAETKVRRLLDAGIIGVIVAEAERIVEANDHFLEMVGYTRDELASGRLRWPEMTPPEYADLDARGVAELQEHGVCTPFEKEYIRGDGSRIPILIGAAELQREPLLWIGFILDLTERKRAEEEWRAFIDATAHDLRNPLTAVLGQTQLMQRRFRREGEMRVEDAEARLDAIAAAAIRAASLIDDLIDTARLQAGQTLDLRPTRIDLIAVVSACAREARRVGLSHFVRLETDPTPLLVAADGSRIERVIRNILDNAIKYSPDGGEVIVRAGREEDESGSWAVVSIEDRGVGIPIVDLPHVFERFRRGGNVASRIYGSGIGLTGAQQIVEQHGGAITVASVEGEGSIFTLRLPLQMRADHQGT